MFVGMLSNKGTRLRCLVGMEVLATLGQAARRYVIFIGYRVVEENIPNPLKLLVFALSLNVSKIQIYHSIHFRNKWSKAGFMIKGHFTKINLSICLV